MRINYDNMGYNNTATEMSATKTASPAAVEPVSRTYQYRKVMKPMLERKRRARINRCLDELKELMVTALQSEGENVSKLEKADILELTVKHLHKLRHQKRLSSANPVIDADRFRAGFRHAADEVSRCLATIPNVDIPLGTKLMTHLAHRLNEMDKVQPLTIQVNYNNVQPTSNMTATPSLSSVSSNSSLNGDSMSSSHYQMPLTPASSARSTPTTSPQPADYHTNNLNHYHHSVIQHTQGLLKVVPIIDLKVWRPW